MVVRNTRITREIMQAAPRLAVIGRHGVGYDTVDIAAATDLGIPVVYTPAANTESVAEIAIGFILGLGRKIYRAHAAMQSEELLRDDVTLSVMAQRRGLVNFDLWGKTLGVVGVGRIGSSVSKKVIAAFNMKVLGLRPVCGRSHPGWVWGAKSGQPGRTAAAVRFYHPALPRRGRNPPPDQCPHPGADETRRLPDQYRARQRGGWRSPGAGRAGRADSRGGGRRVRSRASSPGYPLLHLENVIVTPHFCAMTEESLYNMGTVVSQGVLDVLEGKRPQFMVNPEIWEKRRK